MLAHWPRHPERPHVAPALRSPANDSCFGPMARCAKLLICLAVVCTPELVPAAPLVYLGIGTGVSWGVTGACFQNPSCGRKLLAENALDLELLRAAFVKVDLSTDLAGFLSDKLVVVKLNGTQHGFPHDAAAAIVGSPMTVHASQDVPFVPRGASNYLTALDFCPVENATLVHYQVRYLLSPPLSTAEMHKLPS